MHRICSIVFSLAFAAGFGACSASRQREAISVQSQQTPAASSLPAEVDAFMQAAVAHDKFSGTILIAREGKPLVERSYGLASIEHGVPCASHTQYLFGSISKQFAATAILQLQQAGRLDVNDLICKYLDDCPPAWNAVRIHHLLSHTSGIPNFSSLPTWDEKEGPQQFSREEFLKLFRDLPLEFTPGEDFAYSNSGYYLLGLLVERVAGVPYAQYVQRSIFAPAGMVAAGPIDRHEVVAHMASGYDWRANRYVKPEHTDVSSLLGCGDMRGTVHDLLAWDKALTAGKILPAPALEKMVTPVRRNHAYGWQLAEWSQRAMQGHSGSLSGFSTFFARFPSDGVCIIVLSNSDRTSASAAAKGLAAIVFGTPYQLPTPTLGDALWNAYERESVSGVDRLMRESRAAKPERAQEHEEELNVFGYELMRDKGAADAVAVFALAVELFPLSANAHDSLGEGLMNAGMIERSIASYQRSLELDANNANAVRMIEALKSRRP